MWLYDFDGRRYLDAVSSWWVNLFGHGNPRIGAALKDQLDRLEHVMLAGFTHEPVVELSEKLSALTGGTLGRCFYASDGASAVEIALKMSAHYWRNVGKPEKNRFLCLEGSYHGETIGALAVTDLGLYKDAYQPLLRNASTVPSPDWRRAEPGETPGAFAARQARALDLHLARHSEEIAALIVEPLIQCATGMGMYAAEYLRQARAICDRHGVHLIADEIAVGFGRTGSFFACEQAGIWPDFLCLSKGLTAGYLPLSVVLTHDAVYQVFYDDHMARGFLHSHSYTGNALACRAALASLAIFEDDQVIEANHAKSPKLTDLCQEIAQHPKVRHFRHCGMVWAFEVDSDDPHFARNFFAAALEAELLLRPIGNTVYFMPPYVINEDESRMLTTRTLRIIDNLAR